MPKSVNMNRRKNNTLTRFGRELIKVVISLLIEGIEFMLFRGLIILKFLKDLRFTDDLIGRKNVLISTMLKELNVRRIT